MSVLLVTGRRGSDSMAGAAILATPRRPWAVSSGAHPSDIRPLSLPRGAAKLRRRMLYGLTIFATDYTLQPADVARAAEERGFESLWLPEHTHIPAGGRTPRPRGAGLP